VRQKPTTAEQTVGMNSTITRLHSVCVQQASESASKIPSTGVHLAMHAAGKGVPTRLCSTCRCNRSRAACLCRPLRWVQHELMRTTVELDRHMLYCPMPASRTTLSLTCGWPTLLQQGCLVADLAGAACRSTTSTTYRTWAWCRPTTFQTQPSWTLTAGQVTMRAQLLSPHAPRAWKPMRA
jgi:hypothetical protein